MLSDLKSVRKRVGERGRAGAVRGAALESRLRGQEQLSRRGGGVRKKHTGGAACVRACHRQLAALATYLEAISPPSSVTALKIGHSTIFTRCEILPAHT